MTKKISPELLAGFSAEATELLVRIAANVEQVHLQPDMVSHLDEARRAAHQAKGAASMIGLADLAHVCYFMEEALEELRVEFKEIERLRIETERKEQERRKAARKVSILPVQAGISLRSRSNN